MNTQSFFFFIKKNQFCIARQKGTLWAANHIDDTTPKIYNCTTGRWWRAFVAQKKILAVHLRVVSWQHCGASGGGLTAGQVAPGSGRTENKKKARNSQKRSTSNNNRRAAFRVRNSAKSGPDLLRPGCRSVFILKCICSFNL